MPKYSISGKYSLKDTLQAMGVVSAFSDTADFSAMTTSSVKLSKVSFENTPPVIVWNCVLHVWTTFKKCSFYWKQSIIWPLQLFLIPYIQVEHQAILNVNEKGTEASAVTTAEIILRGILRPEGIQININRPFLVFITDKTSKSVLFMGKISNPTALWITHLIVWGYQKLRSW